MVAAITVPSPELIRKQTDRIASGRAFANSERMCRFLRYAVEHALQGDTGRLKEYTVGVDIFDRDPSYDPRVDPIVRVEARRLRAKLATYYEGEGRDDEVVIEFPKGSYAPVFRTRGGAGSSDQAEAAGRTIAVLPFTDLGSGHRNEYFADGLTEEIIHALTKVDGLRVMAWTSAAQLKGRQEDLHGLREQLNVSFVLRGSVRRTAERLRITAQLIDTATGQYEWSEAYDRPADDLFFIEEGIARNIVSRLAPKLAPPTGGSIVKRGPTDLKCYNLCLKGRFHWNKRSVDEMKKAIRCFEEAIALDPTCVRAYTGLADAFSVMGDCGGMEPAVGIEQAREAALKALELDPNSASAHASLGLIRGPYEWNWQEAEACFRRAIELHPGYATAHHWYSVDCLALVGRIDEAAREIDIAYDLDPLSGIILDGKAMISMFQRDYERAVEQYSELLDLDPSFSKIYGGLGRAYMLMGEYDRAIAMLLKARSLTGNLPTVLGALGQTYGVSQRHEEARAVLKELHDMAKRRYVPSTCFALTHLGLGENNQALQYLWQGCERREPSMASMGVHPAYDALRSNEQFGCILVRVGLNNFVPVSATYGKT